MSSYAKPATLFRPVEVLNVEPQLRQDLIDLGEALYPKQDGEEA
jgi:hypothetical protein